MTETIEPIKIPNSVGPYCLLPTNGVVANEEAVHAGTYKMYAGMAKSTATPSFFRQGSTVLVTSAARTKKVPVQRTAGNTRKVTPTLLEFRWKYRAIPSMLTNMPKPNELAIAPMTVKAASVQKNESRCARRGVTSAISCCEGSNGFDSKTQPWENIFIRGRGIVLSRNRKDAFHYSHCTYPLACFSERKP